MCASLRGIKAFFPRIPVAWFLRHVENIVDCCSSYDSHAHSVKSTNNSERYVLRNMRLLSSSARTPSNNHDRGITNTVNARSQSQPISDAHSHYLFHGGSLGYPGSVRWQPLGVVTQPTDSRKVVFIVRMVAPRTCYSDIDLSRGQ